MQKIPLISFIIPAYNLPTNLLKECIDSILSLSLSSEEREIIVVDDGSDVSPINELADIANDIIYIRQANKGLSYARNTGIRLATGRYIQFVDGDDKLMRIAYEHCLDIARYHNPDVVFFELTTNDRKQVETPFTYDGPVTGSEYMRDNNIRAAAWGYIFEKSILGNLRFKQGIFHEDEEFTPQLFLRSERFYATDAAAYYYRQREGSIMNDVDENHIKKLLNDTEHILLHLQSLVVPEADRAALNRRIAQLTMDYIYNIIHRTHDRKLLEDTLRRLQNYGLYPLPDKDYTKKYKLFRKMMSGTFTRRLLFHIIK